MDNFSEEAQPLLQQFKQRHFIFRVLHVFLAVTVAILLIVIIQQSVSLSTVNKEVEPNILEAPAPGLLIDNNARAKETIPDESTKIEGNSDVGTSVNPIVAISNGEVRGATFKSRLGRAFSAFYNMPYAESPVGEFRFKPPRPYKTKWENVFDGTVRGTSETECIQFKGYEVSGVEDCLKISVFSPKLPSPENPEPNLPVMFYILGGAYIFGRSNRYGAEYIMDEDVILVHVDFRVGPFGHLSTEDHEIRGNMAFKDQVLALKWVQENIAKFGGDPKKVVIFGNSSGAASVHAHIISNMSKGLFHRAISQSGSVLLDPGRVTRPSTTVKNLGRLLKCPELQNSTALHQCLINADPKRIVSMYSLLPDTHVMTREAIPKDGDMSEVFFEDLPAILLKKGKFNKDIPWISGSNSAEAYASALGLLRNDMTVKGLNAFWDYGAPVIFNFEDDKNHKASAALKDLYFHGEDISNKTRYELTNCMSDISWVHPTVKAADLHAKFGGKVYYFWITHEPVQSYGESSKRGYAAPYGVAHADEVQYFFPFDPFPIIDKQSDDFHFSTSIIKIWTDFARTGIPEVPGGETWLPLDRNNPRESAWMELNGRHFQLVNPLKERMQFLDSFPLLDPNYEYSNENLE
ncbi:unnamed protein product [Allacma fusca]|uniref:Carboxylic ester hydrolase n=1 Tax=Allacma fusca TaxID=39272 RepID=A0A8J2KMH2_9HEXA|nr:unnamed protein product [Allacma fusca]